MDGSAVPADTRFEITIVNSGESFRCPGPQPVLKAMVALGHKGIPSGCHGGGCGVCKVRVVDGEYRTDPMSRDHVSAEDEAQGIALACRVYPLSDIRLEVLGKMRRAVATKRYGLV